MIALYHSLHGFSKSKRAILLALVLSLALATIPVSASNPADDFAAIDRYIESEMDAGRIPGLALGIVKGDEILYLKGYGKADETGRPVTPQTPFVLGSTTKSFTALAIMQLVEAGKVELDAPVQRYLPWFRVADPKASEQITIRHLLNQTIGLPYGAGTAYIAKENAQTSALEEEVRALKDVKPNRPVGESFEYCNLNYGTLGLVIESVTGESYEQYVEENIFAQLGMNNSYASYQEAQQHDLAQGYLLWWGMPKPYKLIYNRAGLPSGYLVSSAEDMSHYLIAHLNGGRFGDVSVLSEKGVADMHLAAAPTTMMGTKAYGMGWFIAEMDGESVIWHAGGVANGHSDLILSPETDYGIFVVFNSSHILDSAGSEIAEGVFSLLLGHQPPAPARRFPTAQVILLGVLIIQVIGIVLSLNTFKRWRSQPESMPRGRTKTALNIWLPFALNLLWAVLLLFVIPSSQGSRIQDLTMMDIGQEAILSGFLALGWGVVRTAFVYRILRARIVTTASSAK